MNTIIVGEAYFPRRGATSSHWKICHSISRHYVISQSMIIWIVQAAALALARGAVLFISDATKDEFRYHYLTSKD